MSNYLKACLAAAMGDKRLLDEYWAEHHAEAKAYPKWSNHTDDVCPHCEQRTGSYAPTYRFNLMYMDCPHCGQTSISGYDNGVFRWFKLTGG